jgi:hypothetical protein
LNIYVASSWRNRLQIGVVTALRSLGYECYDFRNPLPGETGFSWKSIDPEWMHWTVADWRQALKTPIAQSGFALDKGGMSRADVCVLVLPAGRSAHLEAGFMAGQGKPVYTLALEPVEPELMALLGGPAENICCTMEELFERVERAK